MIYNCQNLFGIDKMRCNHKNEVVNRIIYKCNFFTNENLS